MTKELKREIVGPSYVASGDTLDFDYPSDITVDGGRELLSQLNTTGAQYAVDLGAGSLADGTGTGSTTTVTFAATYTATPFVSAGMAGNPVGAFVGSQSVHVAGTSVGSAVIQGLSGAGFNWFSIGRDY